MSDKYVFFVGSLWGEVPYDSIILQSFYSAISVPDLWVSCLDAITPDLENGPDTRAFCAAACRNQPVCAPFCHESDKEDEM